MRARTLSLAAIAAALVIVAAQAAPAAGLKFGWPGGEKGSGTIVTRNIEVAIFDRIALDGGLDVFVSVGGDAAVKAAVDDNLIDNLVAEVGNGTLRLDWKKDCRPSRKSRVDITLPELTAFTINGAGDVEITGARGAELTLRINGAGDMEVAGEVDSLDLVVSGAGDVDARDLIAKDVEVRVSGAGDADVHATRSLDAAISGVGDITYAGDPAQKRTHVSGVGDISRR